MKKYFIRAFTPILVACLITDSATASVFTGASTRIRALPCPPTLLVNQALIVPALSFLHPITSRYRTSLSRLLVSSRPEFWRFRLATKNLLLRQSFSGIRATFGGTADDPTINRSYLTAFSIYAYLYAQERLRTIPLQSHETLKLVIGGDPRPSGQEVTQAILRGIRAAQAEMDRPIEIIDIGLTTTPMLESAIRTLRAHGGVMVTASHNPLKDNGIKFMTGAEESSGALLSSPQMDGLIQNFAWMRKDYSAYRSFQLKLHATRAAALSVSAPPKDLLRQVLEGYIAELESLFPGIDLRALLKEFPIAIDTNGGAGAAHWLSDEFGVIPWILQHWGMRVFDLNGKLGHPAHDLEPRDESEGVQQMAARLAEWRKLYPRIFGINFDLDADRGKTSDMDAQTITAFNVAMTLARIDAYHLADHQEIVIVATDATSKRIEAIASLFSRPHRLVRVRRVETGEINVVTAMRQERARGYYVPIGVEGPNAGTILNAGTCRDGVATALLTAVSLADEKIQAEWAKVSHTALAASAQVTLPELASTLPRRISREETIPDIELGIAHLKYSMEMEFKEQWLEDEGLRRAYPNYRVRYYEGTEELSQMDGDERGGWALHLAREDGQEDFIWLRPSRTETLARYVIDAADHSSYERLHQLFNKIYSRAVTPSRYEDPITRLYRFPRLTSHKKELQIEEMAALFSLRLPEDERRVLGVAADTSGNGHFTSQFGYRSIGADLIPIIGDKMTHYLEHVPSEIFDSVRQCIAAQVVEHLLLTEKMAAVQNGHTSPEAQQVQIGSPLGIPRLWWVRAVFRLAKEFGWSHHTAVVISSSLEAVKYGFALVLASSYFVVCVLTALPFFTTINFAFLYSLTIGFFSLLSALVEIWDHRKENGDLFQWEKNEWKVRVKVVPRIWDKTDWILHTYLALGLRVLFAGGFVELLYKLPHTELSGGWMLVALFFSPVILEMVIRSVLNVFTDGALGIPASLQSKEKGGLPPALKARALRWDIRVLHRQVWASFAMNEPLAKDSVLAQLSRIRTLLGIPALSPGTPITGEESQELQRNIDALEKNVETPDAVKSKKEEKLLDAKLGVQLRLVAKLIRSDNVGAALCTLQGISRSLTQKSRRLKGQGFPELPIRNGFGELLPGTVGKASHLIDIDGLVWARRRDQYKKMAIDVDEKRMLSVPIWFSIEDVEAAERSFDYILDSEMYLSRDAIANVARLEQAQRLLRGARSAQVLEEVQKILGRVLEWSSEGQTDARTHVEADLRGALDGLRSQNFALVNSNINLAKVSIRNERLPNIRGIRTAVRRQKDRFRGLRASHDQMVARIRQTVATVPLNLPEQITWWNTVKSFLEQPLFHGPARENVVSRERFNEALFLMDFARSISQLESEIDIHFVAAAQKLLTIANSLKGKKRYERTAEALMSAANVLREKNLSNLETQLGDDIADIKRMRGGKNLANLIARASGVLRRHYFSRMEISDYTRRKLIATKILDGVWDKIQDKVIQADIDQALQDAMLELHAADVVSLDWALESAGGGTTATPEEIQAALQVIRLDVLRALSHPDAQTEDAGSEPSTLGGTSMWHVPDLMYAKAQALYEAGNFAEAQTATMALAEEYAIIYRGISNTDPQKEDKVQKIQACMREIGKLNALIEGELNMRSAVFQAHDNQSPLFGFSGDRSQGMSNQETLLKVYPEISKTLIRPLYHDFVEKLTELLELNPDYQAIRRNSDVHSPSYFYDLLKRKNKYLPLLFFDPRLNYLVVVVEKFLAANMSALSFALSFAGHEIGHLVDANGGIVWKSPAQRDELTVRERNLLQVLPRKQRRVLAETIVDFRAETYRRNRFPVNETDPIANSKYYELMNIVDRVLAISKRRIVQIARAIVMCEWVNDHEKAAHLRKAVLEPLKDKNERSYRAVQAVVTFLRDYVKAIEFDPSWAARINRKAA